MMKVLELGRDGGVRERALLFETGDPVIETLRAFARAETIRAARFTALGALRTATLAYFDWPTRDCREIPVDEQVELHGEHDQDSGLALIRGGEEALR